MKRGRKSSTELEVSTVSVAPNSRPDAPYDLTDDQADEWRAVVGRMPADWFPRETWGVLSAYCRHVVTHRLLSREIDRWPADWFAKDDDGLKRFDRLLAMRERESRATIAAARSLRITKSSQIRPEGAGRAARDASAFGTRPWDHSPNHRPAVAPKPEPRRLK